MRPLHLFCLVLATPALADGAPPTRPYAYVCDGGATLQVVYFSIGGADYAVLGRDGQLASLKAGPTGSGVRYVSTDGSGLVWHVKGAQGFLARDDADETMLLTDCIEHAKP